MFQEFLYDFDRYLIDNMYPIELEDDDGEKNITAFIEDGKSFEFNKRRIEKALNHFNSEEDSEYVGLASNFKLVGKDEDGIEISFDVNVMKKEKQVEKVNPKEKTILDSSYDDKVSQEKIEKLNRLKNKRVVVTKGKKVPIGTEEVEKSVHDADDEPQRFKVEWLDIEEKKAGKIDYTHVSTIHGKDAIEVLNKLGAALAVKGKNPRFIWINRIQTPIKNYVMSGDLEHLLTKESIEE